MKQQLPFIEHPQLAQPLAAAFADLIERYARALRKSTPVTPGHSTALTLATAAAVEADAIHAANAADADTVRDLQSVIHAVEIVIDSDRLRSIPAIRLADRDPARRAQRIRTAVETFLRRSQMIRRVSAGATLDCERLAQRFLRDAYSGPPDIRQLIVLNGLAGPVYCPLNDEAILVKLTPGYLAEYFGQEEECDPLSAQDLLGLAALEIVRPLAQVPSWSQSGPYQFDDLQVAQIASPYIKYINLRPHPDVVGALALYQQSHCWVEESSTRSSVLMRPWMLKFLTEDEATWNQRTVASISDCDEFRRFVAIMERGRQAAARISDAADRALNDYGDACTLLSCGALDAGHVRDAQRTALLTLCRCLETTYAQPLSTPERTPAIATLIAALCDKREEARRRLRDALCEAFELRWRLADLREQPDRDLLARATKTVREAAQASVAMLLTLGGDQHALIATTGCVSIH